MMCLLMSLFLYFFSIACIALSYEELWTTAVRGKSEPPIALIHYWKCVLPTRWVNTSAQRCKARFKSRQCCLTMLTRGKQKKRLNNALGQSRKEGKDEKREDRFRGERRASGDTKILRCAQDDRRGKS